MPVVNENDTIADDEIRYGDNDRLAALVAHLVGADLLVLLTDTAGLFTADPRLDDDASLIEEIVEVDAALEAVAGGAGTARGSGGMASKLAAAKIAAWSGVRAVIAAADAPDGRASTRSTGRRSAPSFAPRAAAPVEPQAVDRVRAGARRAHRRRRRRPPARSSTTAGRCSPAGVRDVEGAFDADDAVEIVDADGAVVRQGPGALLAPRRSARVAGRRTADLPDGPPPRGRPPRRPRRPARDSGVTGASTARRRSCRGRVPSATL